jgi:hypothetical protein
MQHRDAKGAKDRLLQLETTGTAKLPQLPRERAGQTSAAATACFRGSKYKP